MSNIAFQTIDWEAIAPVVYDGQTGRAYWRTVQYPGLRVRVVEYTSGYFADHWCSKGHIVYCIEGAMVTELENGERHILTAGMTYVVSDDLSTHRSVSEGGAKLMIIDGDFLKNKD